LEFRVSQRRRIRGRRVLPCYAKEDFSGNQRD
jgi:hypothetical protein